MQPLYKYLQTHCEYVPENSKGDIADLAFFKMRALGNPNAEELTSAIKSHSGEFNEVDLFDGKEHNYIEIGGWIGDQGAALMLMGLGSILGLWKLMTPRSIIGPDTPEDLVMQMAGMGMVAIQSPATN